MKDEKQEHAKNKVVAILERHLNQDARVFQNEFLEVIPKFQGRKKRRRPRQINVLIDETTPGGTVRTIIEVQKRDTPVGIDQFNAWHVKMQEVGAQNLLCVSERGFRSSVLDRADNIGPSVRLYTLKQLEGADTIPGTTFSQKLEVVNYIKLNALQMRGEHLMKLDPKANPKAPPDMTEKMFKFPDGNIVAAEDIFDWHFFRSSKHLDELPRNKRITVQINYEWPPGQGIFYRDFGGTWVPLSQFVGQMHLDISEHELTWTTSEYSHVDFAGEAWAVSGTADVNGQKLDIVTPLKNDRPGAYSAGRPVVMGNFAAFMSINGTVYKAERFEAEATQPKAKT